MKKGKRAPKLQPALLLEESTQKKGTGRKSRKHTKETAARESDEIKADEQVPSE